jgi:hypothetical protein
LIAGKGGFFRRTGELNMVTTEFPPASKMLARIKAERDTLKTRATIAKKATTLMIKADKVLL